MRDQYLVTSALTYANGALHLGHMLEYIQTDIFVRALKMMGEDVLYAAGIDAHGTAIEVNAQKANVAPEQFVAGWQTAYQKTLANFGVAFDGAFGSTHSASNQAHANTIFSALQKAGHISVRDVEQFYDPETKRFLSDRLIKGSCPKCGAADQYGDSCEACGVTYKPTDLLNPRSLLSGAAPVLRSSKHYFFELSHYTEALKDWTAKSGVLSPDMQNYLSAWFKDGLKDWDISRDGPYFGFKIPGEDSKYFYVWLDAPIGYISISQDAAKLRNRTLEDYWKNPNTKIVHFIGKDIVYFHTLFWPAMLMAAGYTTPSAIAVHGMLTINGEKMSKSRGTFILADDFAKHFDPQALRYYFACKLGSSVSDIDLSFDDFISRVNTDLVNKIVNLISRTVPLLHRYFDGRVSGLDTQAAWVSAVGEMPREVQSAYQKRESAQVCKSVVSIADIANKYLQDSAPWDLVKSNPEQAQRQLTTALWAGKVCVGLLKPILPEMAKQVETLLSSAELNFSNLLEPLNPDTALQSYTRLFERLDSKKVNEMLEQTPAAEISNAIAIEDFMKVELHAAKVIHAENVEGSDKLISVKVDVGPLGIRHVFSGLRPHVEPADMLGQMVVLVTNLKARKMRFGVSEGMILAAVGDKPRLISAAGSAPGDRIQ